MAQLGRRAPGGGKVAPTRSGGPSGGTTSSCTGAPIFSLAVVLTLAPNALMSRERDK